MECRRDLLLIVDTSYSIAEREFNKSVKPFLKNLVTSPQLDVSLSGTHVGLILFSSAEKTKVELKIGQITNASELARYLNNLIYPAIAGNQTRTELALKMAKLVRTDLNIMLYEPNIIHNSNTAFSRRTLI